MGIETATEQEHAADESTLVVLPPAPDEVSTALAETTSKYQRVLRLVANGRELAERYKGVVADVTTVKGYEQIASIRTQMREECRYPLQKLKKEISGILGGLQRNTNRHLDAMIAEAEAQEQPFQALLDAEDERKRKVREEAERQEAARKQGHAEAIQAIARIPGTCAGMDSGSIELALTGLRDVIVDEGYEEFHGQAQQAKDEAIRQLTGMLVAARADEEDRREAEEARTRATALAAQQAEAARLAQEQAAQERAARESAERETAELRAKLAAAEAREAAERQERERAAREREHAISQRINLLATTGAAYSHMAPAANIANALDELQGIAITADRFGDRMEEAQRAKDIAIGNLREVLAGAVAREAEEAAAAQRTRRNELLSNIVGMGEDALLAVQDGSADAQELQKNVDVLFKLELTEELFGDLLQQAVAARSKSIAQAQQAIEQTLVRDRLAAEEAERRRQQEAEQAAARALADAKRSHGEELYEVLRRMVLHPSQDATNEARALMVLINPAEDFED